MQCYIYLCSSLPPPLFSQRRSEIPISVQKPKLSVWYTSKSLSPIPSTKENKSKTPDSIAKYDGERCSPDPEATIRHNPNHSRLEGNLPRKRPDNISLLAINVPLYLLLDNHPCAVITGNRARVRRGSTGTPRIMHHLRLILDIVAEIILTAAVATSTSKTTASSLGSPRGALGALH